MGYCSGRVLAPKRCSQKETLVNPSQFEVYLHARQGQTPFNQAYKPDTQTEDPSTDGENRIYDCKQDGAFLSA